MLQKGSDGCVLDLRVEACLFRSVLKFAMHVLLRFWSIWPLKLIFSIGLLFIQPYDGLQHKVQRNGFMSVLLVCLWEWCHKRRQGCMTVLQRLHGSEYSAVTRFGCDNYHTNSRLQRVFFLAETLVMRDVTL